MCFISWKFDNSHFDNKSIIMENVSLSHMEVRMKNQHGTIKDCNDPTTDVTERNLLILQHQIFKTTSKVAHKLIQPNLKKIRCAVCFTIELDFVFKLNRHLFRDIGVYSIHAKKGETTIFFHMAWWWNHLSTDKI